MIFRVPLLIFGCALVAAFLAIPAVAQPVAWYPFDDGTASDASGNGHHGAIVGSPSLEEGIVGQALRFDGDSLVRVPDSPDLQIEHFSVSAWIKLDGAPSSRGVVARKMSQGTGYRVGILANGKVRLDLFANGVRTGILSPFPVVPGVWTSIFAAYDGATLKLYLHGSLAASAPAPNLSVAAGGQLVIAKAFDGLVDEIKIGEGGTALTACVEALKRWHSQSSTCVDNFDDATAELAVADTANRSFGATLVDINDDGWIDLYWVNGAGNPDIPSVPSGTCPELPDPVPFEPGSANVLHLNRGDGTFAPDSAPNSGIDDRWNAMRHVWGDYDNDGLRDLFSHNFILSNLYKAVMGPEPLVYENYNHALEVCLSHGTGASWVDLNNDGFLDMYAVEYRNGWPAERHVNKLYMADGAGSFVDITDVSGIDLPDNPMGVVFGDYDNDGDQDVFVTNSHEVPSRLYRHDGIDPNTGMPHFTDVGAEAGVAVIGEPNKGIGAGWGDYNNDGRLDLLFVRERDTRLFRNDGPDDTGAWKFTDVTGQGGLVMDGRYWGGNFADLNNDGWLDIALANRSRQPNRVYLSNADGTWREVAGLVGMNLNPYLQMGFVAGDIDNDGDLDAVWVTHDLGQPNFVFRNQERGRNWVQLRLTGTLSNLDAVGARITVSTSLAEGTAPIRQIREVTAGTGFFSDFPRIQTFGLDKAQVVRKVTIRWPSGQVQNIGPLEVNRRYHVVEPMPAGDPLDLPARILQ